MSTGNLIGKYIAKSLTVFRNARIRQRWPESGVKRLERLSDEKAFETSGLGPVIDVIRNVSHLRQRREAARSSGKRVALVPTMGALHDGHLALVRAAARHAQEVYVSIYVNPTQFGVNEDLDSYPRSWHRDLIQLRQLNRSMEGKEEFIGKVTNIFNPTTNAMYPSLPPTSEIHGSGSFVNITPLANVLEGAARPVFFRGVATVVMKLLNLVQPDEVVFGQKDIQQVLVIKRMIEDFHINTQLFVSPTERERDGLAMSSRNVYLGDRRRRIANVIYKAMQASQMAWMKGKRDRRELLGPALGVAKSIQDTQRALLPSERAGFEVDYMSLADPVTLEEIQSVDEEHGAILSAAVIMQPIEEPQIGENLGLGRGLTPVRLIDNCIYGQHKVFPYIGESKRSFEQLPDIRVVKNPHIPLTVPHVLKGSELFRTAAS
ncbi:pantothenate synthase [Xylographa parallela]|nr:pantothenate synthase [Xylographa parallela]